MGDDLPDRSSSSKLTFIIVLFAILYPPVTVILELSFYKNSIISQETLREFDSLSGVFWLHIAPPMVALWGLPIKSSFLQRVLISAVYAPVAYVITIIFSLGAVCAVGIDCI